jgi:hypothetical protein
VLKAQVAAADVLLAVVGPRWGELLSARSGDADDFVAIEIKPVLEQGKRVIPVLVGGASMPRADMLPEPIRALARRNAVGLRPCQGLITALKEQLAAAQIERAARTKAEREAAEAARRKSEAAVARVEDVEKSARAQAIAGLSPAEIRKAEELASGQFVGSRQDVGELRDHLARFPGGVTARYALAKLEELVWGGLGATPSIEALQAFVEEFPNGAHAQAARDRLAILLERQASEARAAEERRAKETAHSAAIESFLKSWRDGQHAAAARARIRELKQRLARIATQRPLQLW